MNPKEIFLITRVFKNKIEKTHKMKPAYTRTYDFLKDLVCEFTKIDAKIYPVLEESMNFPPFEHAPVILKIIQDLSLGSTNFPDLGIILKITKDSEKISILSTLFHMFSKKQIEDTILYVEKSKFTTDEVKFELTRIN